MLAGPVVLGEDAGGVLHRHVVAGEGHHAGAERPHARHGAGSSGAARRLCAGSAIGFPRKARVPSGLAARCSAPPLSRDLRDFPWRCSAQVTPVGGRRLRNVAAFQSASSRAVLWPERFRGGCAFGAGREGPVSPAGIIGWLSSEEDLHACQQSRALLAHPLIDGRPPERSILEPSFHRRGEARPDPVSSSRHRCSNCHRSRSRRPQRRLRSFRTRHRLRPPPPPQGHGRAGPLRRQHGPDPHGGFGPVPVHGPDRHHPRRHPGRRLLGRGAGRTG